MKLALFLMFLIVNPVYADTPCSTAKAFVAAISERHNTFQCAFGSRVDGETASMLAARTGFPYHQKVQTAQAIVRNDGLATAIFLDANGCGLNLEGELADSPENTAGVRPMSYEELLLLMEIAKHDSGERPKTEDLKI